MRRNIYQSGAETVNRSFTWGKMEPRQSVYLGAGEREDRDQARTFAQMTVKTRQWLDGITPERRILEHGVGSLTDAELLAVLLGDKEEDSRVTRDLATRLLGDRTGLLELSRMFDESAGTERTPKRGHHLILRASFELGRRMARAEVSPRNPMTHPAAVVRYLALRFTHSGQEIMGALFLDSRNGLIRDVEIYRGTLNRASVEPRGVLKQGLLCDAAGFVLFHTHPSGDPSPSAEDLAFTRRMAQSGEILGVRLIDHLILGSASSWVSLRQRSAW